MQWIKASERLPELKGEKNKVIARKGNEWAGFAYRNYSEENPQMIFEIGIQLFCENSIEWLDESQVGQSPEPKGEGVLNKIMDVLPEAHPEVIAHVKEQIREILSVPETPHPKKPFIVANVREVVNRYMNEDISFSRMVEMLNEMVFQWQSHEGQDELWKEIISQLQIEGASERVMQLLKQSFTIKRNP